MTDEEALAIATTIAWLSRGSPSSAALIEAQAVVRLQMEGVTMPNESAPTTPDVQREVA